MSKYIELLEAYKNQSGRKLLIEGVGILIDFCEKEVLSSLTKDLSEKPPILSSNTKEKTEALIVLRDYFKEITK